MTPQHTKPSPTNQTQAAPPTQMLRRHLDRLVGQDILVAGCPPDDAVCLLAERLSSQTATFLTFDYSAYLIGQSSLAKAKNPRHSLEFSSWYKAPKAKHDLAIVYLQKGRELNGMVLSMVRRSLHRGATLFLVGENNAGIRSYREPLEQTVGRVSYSDNARHCVLYQAIYDVHDAEPDSADGVESWVREYGLTVGGQELTVVSLPGVFSHGRIDKGTAFLLDHMTVPDCGEVLDFGCGSGVIAAVVKLLKPLCNVTLVDSSVFAIDAAKRTFARNSISAQAIIPSDVFSAVSASYDLIVSNPPFHQGIGTDYEAVTSFISQSRQHLRDQGALMIVANRFLKYEPLLVRDVGPTMIASEDKAYKVFVAKRGSGPSLPPDPKSHARKVRRS